jgi:hypothetical protein
MTAPFWKPFQKSWRTPIDQGNSAKILEKERRVWLETSFPLKTARFWSGRFLAYAISKAAAFVIRWIAAYFKGGAGRPAQRH